MSIEFMRTRLNGGAVQGLKPASRQEWETTERFPPGWLRGFAFREFHESGFHVHGIGLEHADSRAEGMDGVEQIFDGGFILMELHGEAVGVFFHGSDMRKSTDLCGQL